MTKGAYLLQEETGDGILIVTLNRPDKLNALSNETMAIFETALWRFRDSENLKVMLIRATGRYFCAGADVREGGGRRPGTGIGNP